MFIIIIDKFTEFSYTQPSPLSFFKTHNIRCVSQAFSYPFPNFDTTTIPVKDSKAVLWPVPCQGLGALPGFIQCVHCRNHFKSAGSNNVLAYKHGRYREQIATSVHQELDRIDNSCQCQVMKSKIHSGKATTLWCSLNNHAVKFYMPEVSIEGKSIKREHTLRYLGVVFDRSLSV